MADHIIRLFASICHNSSLMVAEALLSISALPGGIPFWSRVVSMSGTRSAGETVNALIFQRENWREKITCEPAKGPFETTTNATGFFRTHPSGGQWYSSRLRDNLHYTPEQPILPHPHFSLLCKAYSIRRRRFKKFQPFLKNRKVIFKKIKDLSIHAIFSFSKFLIYSAALWLSLPFLHLRRLCRYVPRFPFPFYLKSLNVTRPASLRIYKWFYHIPEVIPALLHLRIKHFLMSRAEFLPLHNLPSSQYPYHDL